MDLRSNSSPVPQSVALASLHDDDGGLMELSKAAVPIEVRKSLSDHFSRGGKDGCQELAAMLRALATPPSGVSFRIISGRNDVPMDVAEARISDHFAAIEASQGCEFKICGLGDMPPPVCWLACPEARILLATGVADVCKHSENVNADGIADAIIDVACAVAVLRGAEVFCMGVMATSPSLLEGQKVRLWAVPEGTKAPNRGSILNNPPGSWPAVLVAAGQAVLGRNAIFAQGSHGVAINVSWRQGAAAPLAPMNSVLANESLSRSILLQQLPSCAAGRALAPRPGDRVLDMCAAPGGKTTHLAELLGDEGKGLVSVDRSLAKVRRIEALCKSHGFSAVRCIAADSRYLCTQLPPSDAEMNSGSHNEESSVIHEGAPSDKAMVPTENCSSLANNCVLDGAWPPEAEQAFLNALAAHGADRFRSSKRIWKAVRGVVGADTVTRMQVNERLRQHGSNFGEDGDTVGKPAFPAGAFDRILLDPPCSAMGQRPLLRWGKALRDVQDHAAYQRQFLKTAAVLLRQGGELVYSTCTLTPEENEENVRWALDTLPLELLDAREHALRKDPATMPSGLAGLEACGLNDSQRQHVLRFDPRSWDAGFFLARFKRREEER